MHILWLYILTLVPLSAATMLWPICTEANNFVMKGCGKTTFDHNMPFVALKANIAASNLSWLKSLRTWSILIFSKVKGHCYNIFIKLRRY